MINYLGNQKEYMRVVKNILTRMNCAYIIKINFFDY